MQTLEQVEMLKKKLYDACVEIARWKTLWTLSQKRIKELESEIERLKYESH